MARCRFRIGQLVNHRLFSYRGVIYDVDPEFTGSDEWYEMMALSQPPKDKPWYHVLVDGADHSTYVAEQNLDPDLSGEMIDHPEINKYFSDFADGMYKAKKLSN